MSDANKIAENIVVVAGQSAQELSGVAKAGIVLFLGGTSYSLQEINTIISIAAGLFGIFYSVHLLVKFWWDNFWKQLLTRSTLRSK